MDFENEFLNSIDDYCNDLLFSSEIEQNPSSSNNIKHLPVINIPKLGSVLLNHCNTNINLEYLSKRDISEYDIWQNYKERVKELFYSTIETVVAEHDNVLIIFDKYISMFIEILCIQYERLKEHNINISDKLNDYILVSNKLLDSLFNMELKNLFTVKDMSDEELVTRLKVLQEENVILLYKILIKYNADTSDKLFTYIIKLLLPEIYYYYRIIVKNKSTIKNKYNDKIGAVIRLLSIITNGYIIYDRYLICSYIEFINNREIIKLLNEMADKIDKPKNTDSEDMGDKMEIFSYINMTIDSEYVNMLKNCSNGIAKYRITQENEILLNLLDTDLQDELRRCDCLTCYEKLKILLVPLITDIFASIEQSLIIKDDLNPTNLVISSVRFNTDRDLFSEVI